MFLNYNPDLRHPLGYSTFTQVFPSLLTGFHGTDFPAFKRYYGGAKTAFALLLSSFLSVRIPITPHPYSLRHISGGCEYLKGLDSLVWVNPYINPVSCGGGRLSRVPMQTILPLIKPKTPVGFLISCQ